MNWFIAAVCAAAMAFALYLEHQVGLEPCPLCVFQRVAMIAAGVTALVAALHNPAETGIRVYGALTCLATLSGFGLAGRQVWLQKLPEDQVPACGPSLDYLVDVFTPLEVFEMVLAGDGTCAEIVWTFLGVSIPGWTMLGFAALFTMALLQITLPVKSPQL